MDEVLKQIRERLLRAGFKKTTGVTFFSADDTRRLFLEEDEDGGVFARLSLRLGSCFYTEEIFSAQDVAAVVENLVLAAQSRDQKLRGIERFLKMTSRGTLDTQAVQTQAQAWYRAGFESAEAIRPWLLKADVSSPETAASFVCAGLSADDLATKDLGHTDAVTLGHEVCAGLLTPLEAIALVRGVLKNSELRTPTQSLPSDEEKR